MRNFKGQIRANSMTPHSSSTQPPVPSDVKKTLPTVNSSRIMEQSNLDELTPLQRQRLDAAVMILVNYLVSASSAP